MRALTSSFLLCCVFRSLRASRASLARHVATRQFLNRLQITWMTEMLRQGMSPIQLSIIAGASMQVIAEHYTHLTKGDAYDAMLLALTARRTQRMGSG